MGNIRELLRWSILSLNSERVKRTEHALKIQRVTNAWWSLIRVPWWACMQLDYLKIICCDERPHCIFNYSLGSHLYVLPFLYSDLSCVFARIMVRSSRGQIHPPTEHVKLSSLIISRGPTAVGQQVTGRDEMTVCHFSALNWSLYPGLRESHTLPI